jgi:hypothetical protein
VSSGEEFITASGGFCMPMTPYYGFHLDPWDSPDPNPMPRLAPLWSEEPGRRLRRFLSVRRLRVRLAWRALRGEDDELYADDYDDYDDYDD